MTFKFSNDALLGNIQCSMSMILWALGFVALEYMIEDWGIFSLNAIRLLCSSILLMVCWIVIDGLIAVKNAPWIKGLIIGGFGWGLGSMLLYLGQKISDPIAIAIAIAMMPIAGMLVELLLEKKRPSFWIILSIGLAVFGGSLASGVIDSTTENLQINLGLGFFLAIISIFLFTWATRATTNQLPSLTRLGQTTLTLSGGAVILLIIYLISLVLDFSGTNLGAVGQNNIVQLVVYLVISCGIAQLMWIVGAGKIGVMLGSFHVNTVPFIVMASLAFLSLSEWIWIRALGAGIVFAAVLICQLSKQDIK